MLRTEQESSVGKGMEALLCGTCSSRSGGQFMALRHRSGLTAHRRNTLARVETKSRSMADEFEWTAPSMSQDLHSQHYFWGQRSQVRPCLPKPGGNALCTAGWRYH